MDCVHHWIIAEPEGLICHGRCKNCGAERDFHELEHVDYRLTTRPVVRHRTSVEAWVANNFGRLYMDAFAGSGKNWR